MVRYSWCCLIYLEFILIFISLFFRNYWLFVNCLRFYWIRIWRWVVFDLLQIGLYAIASKLVINQNVIFLRKTFDLYRINSSLYLVVTQSIIFRNFLLIFHFNLIQLFKNVVNIFIFIIPDFFNVVKCNLLLISILVIYLIKIKCLRQRVLIQAVYLIMIWNCFIKFYLLAMHISRK